jgi:hypothetical protein
MKKKEADKRWQDRASSWIAHRIIAAQLSLCRHLQKQEQRLTVRQKKVALFIFCLSCGGYLLYLLGSALFYGPTLHLSNEVIRVQENAHPPPDTSLSDKRIKMFKHPQKQKQ